MSDPSEPETELKLESEPTQDPPQEPSEPLVVHMMAEVAESFCGNEGALYYVDKRPDGAVWCRGCEAVYNERYPRSPWVEFHGEEPGSDEAEHPIILTVSNRFKESNGKETCVTDRRDVVRVVKFKTRPAMVRRGYGITLNQKDFSSIRIDVGLELPCYGADLKRADRWAQQFIEDRITEEVTTLRDAGGNVDLLKKKSGPL